MTDRLRILGIAGSLRHASFNRGLIRAAQELTEDGVTIEPYDLSPIPLYDADIDLDGGPPAVRDFKERIQKADALLISTPEYCGSYSGVLKNAIDWASRPAATSVLRGKPAAVFGAANGGTGTVKAQLALRALLHSVRCPTLLEPELAIVGISDKCDQDGTLLDEATRESVRALVAALAAWTRRLNP